MGVHKRGLARVMLSNTNITYIYIYIHYYHYHNHIIDQFISSTVILFVLHCWYSRERGSESVWKTYALKNSVWWSAAPTPDRRRAFWPWWQSRRRRRTRPPESKLFFSGSSGPAWQYPRWECPGPKLLASSTHHHMKFVTWTVMTTKLSPGRWEDLYFFYEY